ncbi:hypothetical protein CBF60_01995 [Lactobacillus taiwanensis]|uniref:hypothetical protein n=1 Tax=Lactobacillus taiwanensis TaxID=508451 RepID=UPI000B995E14|nr:hypothetical protein [Lactobacillus taiwanensis]OYS20901.1 hypothetical protein CBF76_04710 [Lactobacillus taiwanensis]OYS24956.1 hypothetical protein CBF55_03695 [Lactobacillus taiwanensis]OYS26473.1 hypothetical protein CBF66_00710 [Lactobacillus taiwanensis]OYS26766.1 hypothetical protein CBF73_01790 [Lactobacillus taiwanensis]OYS29839.1 hypothetical protein CBF60_01995 [Lactobacillus taiwanensis]
MAIELKIGTRGMREEFEDTYTRSFLEDNGLLKFDPRNSVVNCVWGVHTKYGYMCSFDFEDILTYMGDGVWDLRVAEETKITDEELKRALSEPDKEF